MTAAIDLTVVEAAIARLRSALAIERTARRRFDEACRIACPARDRACTTLRDAEAELRAARAALDVMLGGGT